MKLFEKILLAIILLALILKFTFITGGNILFVFSLILLSLLYYPLGILFFNEIPLKDIFKKSVYKKSSKMRLIGAFSMGMALSLVLLGILFKFQFFPGADVLLLTGLFFSLIVLILIIFKYFKSRAEFYRKALVRSLIVSAIGLFLALLPKGAIREFQFRNYPEYMEAFNKYSNNPDSSELYDRLKIEEDKIYFSEDDFKLIYPNEKY